MRGNYTPSQGYYAKKKKSLFTGKIANSHRDFSFLFFFLLLEKGQNDLRSFKCDFLSFFFLIGIQFANI